MSKEMDEVEESSWWPLILVVCAVILIWIGTVPVAGFVTGETDPSKLGPLGDIFGSINALFSGLAFSGLIYAILLQRKELSFQRQELRDTRKVLESQRVEAVKQNETLQLQAFENTFFQMLKTQHQIVDGLRFTRIGEDLLKSLNNQSQIVSFEKETYFGRDCFREFARILWEEYSKQKDNTLESEVLKISAVYDHFFDNYENHLGHYFRNLYQILKFVNSSAIEAKEFYTGIVRAQLSSAELFLLFYNCLGRYWTEKMKPLVEKYALLHHCNLLTLLDSRHTDHFSQTAFGNS